MAITSGEALRTSIGLTLAGCVDDTVQEHSHRLEGVEKAHLGEAAEHETGHGEVTVRRIDNRHPQLRSETDPPHDPKQAFSTPS